MDSTAALALVLAAAPFPAPADEDAAVPSEVLGEHAAPVERLAVSPDGKLLVTAAKGEIRAWDVDDRELEWTASIPEAQIMALAASEKLIAYHHGQAMASLLETATGEARTGVSAFPPNQPSRCLALDPRGGWVWVGRQGGLSRLTPGNVNAWSNRGVPNGGTLCLAMDPKGKHLAIGGQDGTIRFANAKSTRVDDDEVFEGHAQPVTALAFDHRAATLVSAAEDGELRVWKRSNGKCLQVLEHHTSRVDHLAVDPRSQRFASGDASGRILLWELGSDDPPITVAPASGQAVAGLAFLGKKGDLLATAGGGPQVTLRDLSDL